MECWAYGTWAGAHEGHLAVERGTSPLDRLHIGRDTSHKVVEEDANSIGLERSHGARCHGADIECVESRQTRAACCESREWPLQMPKNLRGKTVQDELLDTRVD
jgi:hypothetical protein